MYFWCFREKKRVSFCCLCVASSFLFFFLSLFLLLWMALYFISFWLLLLISPCLVWDFWFIIISLLDQYYSLFIYIYNDPFCLGFFWGKNIFVSTPYLEGTSLIYVLILIICSSTIPYIFLFLNHLNRVSKMLMMYWKVF